LSFVIFSLSFVIFVYYVHVVHDHGSPIHDSILPLLFFFRVAFRHASNLR
jgi:hypothetical protein